MACERVRGKVGLGAASNHQDAMKIANEAMEAAYNVAKRVRDGGLTRSAGIDELHERFGLNRSSAGRTISNIGCMLAGEPYQRTNNAFATEHFLEMIHRDYGLEALRRAINAVQQHVESYEGLRNGSKLLKIWKIIHKYRGIADNAHETQVTPDENTLVRDLDEINRKRNLDVTTKKALVDARLGQGKFRMEVLQWWGNRCSVTGSMIQAAIRASHIKPWRESSNAERLDPNNGLPLIASLDALFDAGLISFDSSGRLVASSRLGTREREIFGISGTTLTGKPSAKTAEYLAQHRAKHGFHA